MGVEFELKFAANEQVLPKIARMLGEEGQLIQMQTTYYDTPSGALSALRYTLRLRRENQRAVCTLKTPGNGAFRGEWEPWGWCFLTHRWKWRWTAGYS